jgi:hypothetical protein
MKQIIIVILILFIISCEKEEHKTDYRNKYIGKYAFVVCDYFGIETTDSSGTNLIFNEAYDTIEFVGIIDTFETDKLKIEFSKNTSDPNFGCSLPLQIYGKLYPTFSDSGKMDYPEVTVSCSRNWFEGLFINSDSIYINIGTEALIGISELTIYGKKMNK